MSHANDSILTARAGQFWKREACLSATVLLGLGLAASPVWAQEQPNMPYPPPASAQAPAPVASAPNAPVNFQQVPPTLLVPAGTVISVRLSQYLSSDQNHPGDLFNVTLDQPLVVDGWVVARRGQSAYGRVAIAQKSKAGGGRSRLGIELSQLTLVDGQQLPVQTQLTQASGGGPDNAQNVATVGVTTGMGAIIGAAADGGRGAGIGAVAGAAAGMVGVLLTPGKPTVIPEESVLNFQLLSPLTISTVRSQVAFQAVSQQDFASPQNYDRYRGRAPQHIAVPPSPPYYYNNGWGYYYPYPAVRFYGFYGPRFVTIHSHFRGSDHRGHRR